MRRGEADLPDKNTLDVLAEARTGLLRATLLFGSIAVALALIVVPANDRQGRSDSHDYNAPVDTMTTGSVKPLERYVMHRGDGSGVSAQPCLMFPDGTTRGNC